MSNIRVVLADDHPVVRTGIRQLLEQADDITVIGEAQTGAEALQLVKALQPEVLLLDIELPDLSGAEVARQIKEAQLPTHILVLSAYDDKEYIVGLLASGAAGYLTKEEAPEAIIEAVRGVARGEHGWVSRRVAAQLAAWSHEEDPPTKLAALTNREAAVLRLVVEGKTNQEIGAALGISDKTVEKHLIAVFKKLDVASRVEAAVLAVREGLV